VSSVDRDPHFALRVVLAMARAVAHHATSRLSGYASVSGRARGPVRAAVARGGRAVPATSASAPRSIVFVSGNAGKVARLELALGLYCSSENGTDAGHSDACSVVVRQVDLALPEIQADTVREVALRKALDAFSVLREPLVVHDCGLCVAALGDWPGPYTKNANDKLGTEGLLRLLDGVTDRRAGWDDTIVYVDGDGVAKVFGPSETRLSSERYGGEISVSPPKKFERFRGPERALGRCFVPTRFGLTECLADVSEADYQRYRREAPSVWNEFARFWGRQGATETS